MIHFACPCCSGKSYQECCEPYHKGRLPENALTLMRSRYSAYALRLADYIIDTTHPMNPHYVADNRKAWKEEIMTFARLTHFVKLEIVEFIDGDEKAFVTFNAHLKQAGKDVSFSEKSSFEKVGKKWLYRDGETKPFPVKAELVDL